MIEVEFTEGSTCVARVAGDLDVVSTAEVQAALSEALGRGCENVVLDFSRVQYVDSSCMALIVWLDRMLEPRGGKLVLAGANRDVGRVLELSGLLKLAPVISTAADEVEALSAIELPAAEGTPMWEERISFRADTAELAAARSAVVSLLEALGIPESTLFDIRVAVGEALANAMRHGSPGGSADVVVVTVEAYDDRVAIEVSDQGCGFDGTLPAEADLYAASGRGVMFMRALMDRVEFTVCDGGGTTVRLEKHVRSVQRVAHRG